MIYSLMMQQGMSSAQLALTGENAMTKAAYNMAYSKTAQRLNAADARIAAEKNIAAIKQDKILSNSLIRMQQDAAEAHAKVNAAVAGVEGQSVNDVIQMTQTNEQRKLEQVQRAGEQSIEDQLSKAMNAQSTLLSVEDNDVSVTGELFQAFSNISNEDIKKGYEIYQKEWGDG